MDTDRSGARSAQNADAETADTGSFKSEPQVHSAFEALKLQIEAILFAAEGLLDAGEIRSFLGEVALIDVRIALKDLANDYKKRAFFLFETGGKVQLRTREEHSELVKKQFASKPRSLSKSALETLAIVAYRQPATRAEINAIRSVDSSSILASLKDRDLIFVAGTRKEVGQPLEYRTTQKFLEVFGLPTLKQLPTLRSLQINVDSQRQIVQAIQMLDGEIEEPITPGELAFPNQVLPPSDEVVDATSTTSSSTAFNTSGDLPEPDV